MRMEPPPSLACATGTMPEATAAAEPPDEPPVEWSVCHGLREGPKRRGSVVGRMPSSGVLVLPHMTKPASSSAASAPGSRSSGSPRRRPGPRRTACRPARRRGPSTGRARRGTARRAARPPPPSRARSKSAWITALSCGFELLDPGDRLVDQLGRRDLPGPDQLGLRRRVQPCGVAAHRANGSEARRARRATPVAPLRRVRPATGSAGHGGARAAAPVRTATASVTVTSAPQAVQRRRSSSSPPQPRCWRIIGRSPSNPVAVAPLEQGHQHRPQVGALLGQAVLAAQAGAPGTAASPGSPRRPGAPDGPAARCGPRPGHVGDRRSAGCPGRRRG